MNFVFKLLSKGNLQVGLQISLQTVDKLYSWVSEYELKANSVLFVILDGLKTCRLNCFKTCPLNALSPRVILIQITIISSFPTSLSSSSNRVNKFQSCNRAPHTKFPNSTCNGDLRTTLLCITNL